MVGLHALLSTITDEVLIELNNVNLRFKNEGYVVSDLSGQIFVHPQPRLKMSISTENPEGITEGKYHEIMLTYSLKQDSVYLYKIKRFGPPSSSSSEDNEGGLGLERLMANIS